jgi:hypothetical protein
MAMIGRKRIDSEAVRPTAIGETLRIESPNKDGKDVRLVLSVHEEKLLDEAALERKIQIGMLISVAIADAIEAATGTAPELPEGSYNRNKHMFVMEV